LDKRGWTESELAARAKGKPGKIEIASRLRTETTMIWIARMPALRLTSPTASTLIIPIPMHSQSLFKYSGLTPFQKQ